MSWMAMRWGMKLRWFALIGMLALCLPLQPQSAVGASVPAVAGTLTSTSSLHRARVSTTDSVPVSVGAGDFHTCGVRSNATVTCWGWNAYGQATAPAGSFKQISGGAQHTCAVKTDNTLTCWGDNQYGQLNNIPSGSIKQFSAGSGHTCAV